MHVGGGVGAVSSFTIDTQLNRWYFYYSGVSSAFGNFSEAVGYADASFINAYPTSQPSSQPLPAATAA